MHDSHVIAWNRWYESEGRHFDNGLRHADYQLDNPPEAAQRASQTPQLDLLRAISKHFPFLQG